MSESEQQRADMERVRKVLTELGEHFDSVQIFCTRHESGELDGTVYLHLGTGNWFARYGQVREWCVKMDAQTHHSQRENNNDDDDP